MLEQMAADGRPALGAPRPHQLWGLSVVLRASSSDGDVFLKCSTDLFRHEAIATRALAERTPGHVPEVMAVEADEGWMLMRDLGAGELGEQDESLWHEGVVVHAGIQRSWWGRTDELVLSACRSGRSRTSPRTSRRRPGTPRCWPGCPWRTVTGG